MDTNQYELFSGWARPFVRAACCVCPNGAHGVTRPTMIRVHSWFKFTA